MNKLKLKFLITLSALLLSSIHSYSQSKMSSQELQLLVGEWEGSLTYLDYRSGEPYTMPANASIKPGKNEFQLNGSYIYPNEPKANSNFKLTVSEDGGKFNKREITSKEFIQDGNIEVITEYQGKDDNRKAMIRNIYVMGSEVFIIRKEVQFGESEEWIKRNEYSFSRKM